MSKNMEVLPENILLELAKAPQNAGGKDIIYNFLKNRTDVIVDLSKYSASVDYSFSLYPGLYAVSDHEQLFLNTLDYEKLPKPVWTNWLSTGDFIKLSTIVDIKPIEIMRKIYGVDFAKMPFMDRDDIQPAGWAVSFCKMFMKLNKYQFVSCPGINFTCALSPNYMARMLPNHLKWHQQYFMGLMNFYEGFIVEMSAYIYLQTNRRITEWVAYYKDLYSDFCYWQGVPLQNEIEWAESNLVTLSFMGTKKLALNLYQMVVDRDRTETLVVTMLNTLKIKEFNSRQVTDALFIVYIIFDILSRLPIIASYNYSFFKDLNWKIPVLMSKSLNCLWSASMDSIELVSLKPSKILRDNRSNKITEEINMRRNKYLDIWLTRFTVYQTHLGCDSHSGRDYECPAKSVKGDAASVPEFIPEPLQVLRSIPEPLSSHAIDKVEKIVFKDKNTEIKAIVCDNILHEVCYSGCSCKAITESQDKNHVCLDTKIQKFNESSNFIKNSEEKIMYESTLVNRFLGFNEVHMEKISRNRLTKNLREAGFPVADTSKSILLKNLKQLFNISNMPAKILLISIWLNEVKQVGATSPYLLNTLVNQTHNFYDETVVMVEKFRRGEIGLHIHPDILYYGNLLIYFSIFMFTLALSLVIYRKIVTLVSVGAKYLYRKLVSVVDSIQINIYSQKNYMEEHVVVPVENVIDIVKVEKIVNDGKTVTILAITTQGKCRLQWPPGFYSYFMTEGDNVAEINIKTPLIMEKNQYQIETFKVGSEMEIVGDRPNNLYVQLNAVNQEGKWIPIGCGVRWNDWLLMALHSLHQCLRLNPKHFCLVGNSEEIIFIKPEDLNVVCLISLDIAAVQIANSCWSKLRTKSLGIQHTLKINTSYTLYGSRIINKKLKCVQSAGIGKANGVMIDHFCSSDGGFSGGPLIFGVNTLAGIHTSGERNPDQPNYAVNANVIVDQLNLIIKGMIKKYGSIFPKNKTVRSSLKFKQNITNKTLQPIIKESFTNYSKYDDYREDDYEFTVNTGWDDNREEENLEAERWLEDELERQDQAQGNFNNYLDRSMAVKDGSLIENKDASGDIFYTKKRNADIDGQKWMDVDSDEEYDYSVPPSFKGRIMETVPDFKDGEDKVDDEKKFEFVNGDITTVKLNFQLSDSETFLKVFEQLSAGKFKFLFQSHQLFVRPQAWIEETNSHVSELKLPTDLVDPQTSYKDEQYSLLNHISAYLHRPCDKPPTEDEKQYAIKHLNEAYSDSKWKIPDDWDSLGSIKSKIEESNQKASVGYDYHNYGCTIEQLRANKTINATKDEWLVQRVSKQIKNIIKHIENLENNLAVLDNVKQVDVSNAGITNHIIRLFIKQEPHKKKKAELSLWRLISSVGIIDQLIDSMVFDPSLQANIKNYRKIPGQTGRSFFYGGANNMLTSFKRRDGDFCSADKRGYDWTAGVWSFQIDRHKRWELCTNYDKNNVKHKNFKKIFDFRYSALVCKTFALSNGFVFQQQFQTIYGKPYIVGQDIDLLKPGDVAIMPSGSKITIDKNSSDQIASKIIICKRTVGKYISTEHELKSMGDDTYERLGIPGTEHYLDPIKYREGLIALGNLPKYIDVHKWSEGSFCSHNFKLLDKDRKFFVAVPTNFDKHVYSIKRIQPTSVSVLPETLSSYLLEYAFDEEHYPVFERILKNIPNSDSYLKTHEQFKRYHILDESPVVDKEHYKPKMDLFFRALKSDGDDIPIRDACLKDYFIDEQNKKIMEEYEKLKLTKNPMSDKTLNSKKQKICSCPVLQNCPEQDDHCVANEILNSKVHIFESELNPEQDTYVIMAKKNNKKQQIIVKVKGKGNYNVPKTSPVKQVVKTAMNQQQSGFGKAKGRGDYFGDLLGSAGSKLGNWLSSKAKAFIGEGDYKEDELHLDDSKIAGNSLMSGTQVPAIKNKGQAFIFRHREYVGDVQPSVNYTNNSFLLNPGNFKTFPWLAPLAAAFEEYQIIGMIAEYKPLVSAVSQNAIGAVVFATEYNVTKPNFTSKIAMENYEYATSCAPHHAMMHAIECSPSETTMTHRNVLTGAVPTNQDPRLYQWGNLQLATQGQANTTGVIGEFWLTYEIACFKPLFSIGQGLSLLTDKYSGQAPNAVNNGSNLIGGGNSLATLNGFRVPGSLLGTTFTSSNTVNATLTFPSNITIGEYMVSFSAVSASTFAAGIFSVPTCTNCQLLQIFSNNVGNDNNSLVSSGVTSVANTAAVMVAVITINAPGSLQASITLGGVTANQTANNYFDIIITQINGNIIT